MANIIEQFYTVADTSGVDVGSLFEQVVKTAYQDILQPGDAAVDVGAHKGYHMFPMADAVGTQGRIYAFEPISPLYAALKKKVRQRGLRQVKLFNMALSNVPGVSTFTYFENMPAYSGLQQRPTPFGEAEGGKQVINVKCRRLDQKMPWFRKISFVKMDIEGGEYHALLGAERMLQKSRPVIIFEHGQNQSADNYNYSVDDFFSLFERHNMAVFLLSGEPYTRDKWGTNIRVWEYVALPKEKASMAEKFSGYCQKVLDNVSKAA